MPVNTMVVHPVWGSQSMPFVCRPGLIGKVYVPEYDPDKAKKHNCRSCYSCQMCSDDRCSVCLNQKELQIMIHPNQEKAVCSCTGVDSCDCEPREAIKTTVAATAGDEEVCCGSPVGPESGPLEKPGYMLCRFVEEFIETPAGSVPRVSNVLGRSDWMETLKVRAGIDRHQYKVTPGLYCIGVPDKGSPVLVSANYKLSFDTLRKEITKTDVWILVLDTRGVNVWCAAGKGTFSTEEVVRRVKKTGLEKVVSHRRLILPQLSATGVSARTVKKNCGFRVLWGPVRSGDLESFITNGNHADTIMRRVTFSLRERTVLIPVEITTHFTYLLWFLLIAFLLSGVGPGVFSISQAWNRGVISVATGIAGIFAGTVIVPILLPWIPGTAFSIKGAIAGFVTGIGVLVLCWGGVGALEAMGIMLFVTAVGSYLAMNFTGSTPFTSPSGVEREMRLAIPFQAGAILLSSILWIWAAF